MITTASATHDDIEGVLALQKKYLYQYMTPKERERGFVTTPFTVAQIEEILLQKGLFVAKNDQKEIVSYVFAADWHYFSQWEIFNYMVSRLPQMEFHGDKLSVNNTFQYGPICIDIPYRGKGLMARIIEEMRREFVKRFPISLTFINAVNAVSTRAHTKLGWEILEEFDFNDNQYITLGLDMTQVLVN